MSVYYNKSSERIMAIRATLQTKLACGALIIIITNVCFLIAIIAFISREEMCKLKKRDLPYTIRAAPINPAELKHGTTINENPWMVAFMILPDEIFLGTGAIIAEKWAITTAYCIEKASKYPISRKGFRGGTAFWNRRGFYHYATDIVSHDKFNSSTLDYNVALVQVLTPFIYVNENPIVIAKTRLKAVKENTDTEQVIGWATINDNLKSMIDGLLHINVELLSKTLCEETLNRLKNDPSIFRSLCTYKKADRYRIECDFTSGSALVVDQQLIGLTSSGVMCSESHLPGIHLNLTTVIDWIEDTINKKIKI